LLIIFTIYGKKHRLFSLLNFNSYFAN
jgi:hypothetical protein